MDPVDRTIELARRNIDEGGRPFACVIVRGSELLAESPNLVAQTRDPTAHAEILAIRDACMKLGTETLTGCEIYALAHPCPMCLGAVYYCSPDRFVFLTTRKDYAPYYRDDRKYFELDTFYDEYAKDWSHRRLPMEYRPRPDSVDVYRLWRHRNGSVASTGSWWVAEAAVFVPTTPEQYRKQPHRRRSRRVCVEPLC